MIASIKGLKGVESVVFVIMGKFPVICVKLHIQLFCCPEVISHLLAWPSPTALTAEVKYEAALSLLLWTQQAQWEGALIDWMVMADTGGPPSERYCVAQPHSPGTKRGFWVTSSVYCIYESMLELILCLECLLPRHPHIKYDAVARSGSSELWLGAAVSLGAHPTTQAPWISNSEKPQAIWKSVGFTDESTFPASRIKCQNYFLIFSLMPGHHWKFHHCSSHCSFQR